MKRTSINQDISFSVIVPLYNKAEYVAQCIDSILIQTYKNFEIIVVDDCSDDVGPEIVQSYSNDNIKIYKIAENRGISFTRNLGISKAKYDFLAFLDADDTWHPDFLETICNLIRRFPSCSVFATSFEFRTPAGVLNNANMINLPTAWEGQLEDYFLVASSGQPFHTSSVVVKKEALEHIGGFPEDMSVGEDVYMWVQLALNHNVAYVNLKKTKYSWGVKDQISTSTTGQDGKLIVKLLDLEESGQVPKRFSASFQRYVTQIALLNARTMIVYGNNGRDARAILGMVSPTTLDFIWQWLWYCFWSLFPGMFRILVGIKELTKTLGTTK